MSVHQDRNSWYVAYSVAGKRKKYFTGPGAEGQIEAIRLDDLRKKGLWAGPVDDKDSGLTFGELAQEYLLLHSLAESTRYLIRLALNKWIMPVWSKTPVSELSLAAWHEIDKALAQAKDDEGNPKPKSIATRNRYGSYCTMILNWGVRRGLLQSNPLAAFRPDLKNENQAPDLITPDELDALFLKAPEHLAWAMECILNLGVRTGQELFNLKMTDVQDGGVFLTRYKTAKYTGTRRFQPVRPDFWAKLETLKKDPARVYLVEYEGLKVNTLKTTWKNTKKRAGITRKLRMTDLRHLYCSTMIANGADVGAVSKLMGHSSERMVLKVYHHVQDAGRKAALAHLPDWQRPVPKDVPNSEHTPGSDT